MMDAERAEGIVLRVAPVTESSLVVTWFTREFGKLKTLAKGARRPKSPMRGKLDLFYRDEILFLWSRRSDLHLLQECFLEEPHAAIRESLGRVTASSFACELVELAMEVEDANGRVFELLAQVLSAVERDAGEVVLIWFELQLLAACGWAPRWQEREGTVRVLRSLMTVNCAAAQRVQLSGGQLSEARELLGRLWLEQVGRRPRARVM
jgi:DNA repair protein RecO (recombination protein O)